MRGQRKNPRKAVQPFENKKRKIDIFKNYEANGVEKIQRKLEIFSTLISKKSIQGKIVMNHASPASNVNFQRFPTLDAKKLVNAPKMSAHHRGICHF